MRLWIEYIRRALVLMWVVAFCGGLVGCGSNPGNENGTTTSAPGNVSEAVNLCASCNDGNPCTTDDCVPATGVCTHNNAPGPCDDNNVCTTNDSCQAGKCVGGPPLDCNDNNVCTNDSCSKTTGCGHAPNSANCNDGNACTSADHCSAGTCAGTATNCDDGNPCTTDSCNPTTGACQHVNNTSPCDDGNACTTADTCNAGKCVGGPALSCNDGNACTNDSCDRVTGCKYVNNTAGCNDGNACTTGDVCSGGVCAGSTRVCNDNNACTDDSCNPATGCIFTNNTASCNDGNACTTNDTCLGGGCHGGAPLNCNDNNSCTNDSCNSASGCVHVNNSATCNDGNLCTTGDHCSAGSCAGTPKNCDDGNACTDDSCNVATGDCAHVNNSAPCDDGSQCTTNDACSDGACVGGAAPNCDDGNPCTDDSCDPATGCHHTDNNAPCNDSNACTQTDTCQAGICVGADPVVCSASDQCHDAGTCDTATGACSNPAKADGEACNDGSACTQTDTCQAGACVGGSTQSCDDTNPCTTDSCDPATGCVNVDNGTCGTDAGDSDAGSSDAGAPECATAADCDDSNPCTDDSCTAGHCAHTNNSLPCNDGSECTTNDTCSDGACAGGSAPNCDDTNPCTDDSCDPATGCVHGNNTAPCNDDNVCTSGDTCAGGICVGGAAQSCDDSNPCTDDSCDPATGCVHGNNTALCDDGNACTDLDVCAGGVCGGVTVDCDDSNPCTDDTCDPSTGCLYDSSTNTSPCDSDGDQCTDDVCAAGTCTHLDIDLDCNDFNLCTDDACNPSTGTCSNTNNVLPCDDGNACTQTDTCQSGTCVGANPVVCNLASDQCHDVGTCDIATGACSNPAKADGESCNDGNACTTGDTCSAGACVGGPAQVCNDNNGCTDDSCDPASGCVHGNNTASCDTDNSVCTPESCVEGVCTAGAPLECDDGDSCTDDSCDAIQGCKHAANGSCPVTDAGSSTPDASTDAGADAGTDAGADAGTDAGADAGTDAGADASSDASAPPECTGAGDCDDSNPCTDDSCNAGTCAHTNNNASCDDGNACTTGDVCANGSCQAGAGTLNCNDGNPCTDDSCNPTTGCHTESNTAPCNDGSACTTVDACAFGACVGSSPLVCNDNNACTNDSCDPASGCVFTNNAAPCEDGNPCTSGDACSGGSCTSGGPTVCDDANPCTDDYCDPALGCQTAPNSNDCDDGQACTAGDICDSGACLSGAVVCAYCGDGHVDPGEQCDDGNLNDTDTCRNNCTAVYCATTTVLARSNAVSSGNENGSLGPAKAIDADLTSRWSSAFVDPSWIYFDMGATKFVSSFTILWQNASARTYLVQLAPNGKSVAELATDAPWTTLYTSPISPAGARTDTVNHLDGFGRYVRMKGLTRNTVFGYSIFDFSVTGDDSSTCQPPPFCGNGVVESSETCDDGNAVTETCTYNSPSCTVCDSTCHTVTGTPVYCGDGVVQTGAGETCDDGNAVTETCPSREPCTVCDSACHLSPGVAQAYCGDGVTQNSSGEFCDDGAANGTVNGTCTSTCTFATCSDGIRDQGEDAIDCGGPCAPCAFCQTNQFTLSGATASGGTPANAINGAAGAWTPTAAFAQWIYVDLGADKQINRVQLEWGTTIYAGYYTIQVAPDGATNLNGAAAGTAIPWTSIYTQLLADGTANVDNITGLNAKGRYVRIYYWQLNSTTATAVNLNELKVFGDDNAVCSPSTGSCGVTSDIATSVKYENDVPGNTCAVVLGGAACATGSGGTGNYTDMNAARTVLSFANVNGGTTGGAATVYFSAAAATGTNTRVALYVKYAEGTEQGYGIVTLNATNNTTFVDTTKAQVYLKAGAGNTVELRDASAGTRPRVDYMMVEKLNGPNLTCIGAPFKVSSYDNGTDFGSRDAGTVAVTTGDFRAITDKAFIGNSNNTGTAGDKYQLTYGTSATYRIKLSNLSGLDAAFFRLRLNSNGTSTLTLDLTSDGTTFSTAVALVSSLNATDTNSGYGGIPSNGSDSGPDGIVNVPISAFGLTTTQLAAVNSIRLKISSNTEWRIKDISLVK